MTDAPIAEKNAQKKFDSLKRSIARLNRLVAAQAKQIKALEDRPAQAVVYRTGGNLQ